jgi:alkylation response protein AidB-like acyl-CoA dehydrogenase
MLRHHAYTFAENLDRDLGDPHDPDGPLSYRRCAELDRCEALPAEALARLDSLGLPRHYVPARFGGALDSYETALMLVRMVARRDFTIALAHAKTYLGSACTWVGGAPAQATDLAAKVLNGDAVALALTEVEHGSDLLAGEVVADDTAAGYRLSGDKWLINNATRGQVICVLARTAPSGGPRGFTLLLVDKRDLAPGTYRPLPAVRTHGVRGADISGIGFTGALVPHSAVVGAPGAGLEIVLKSMQLTRTMCSGLSLGMGDHALRLAVTFATGHRIYRRPLIDLPQAARSLATAYTDLLTAEVVTLVGARSIHCLTGEQGITSAIVKFWVPTVLDRAIASLSRVLGARAALVEDFADGRFQKLHRDHQIVGIFDGSTHVNLAALINEFPTLARGYRRRRVDAVGLGSAVSLGQPTPQFDRDALRLLSRGGCSVVQGLPDSIDELIALDPGSQLAALGAALRDVVDDLHERLAAYRPTARDVPTEAFDLATRYADCYAAAACVHVWLRGREAAGDDPAAGPWRDGSWLAACLARLLGRLRPVVGAEHHAALDRLLPTLRTQHADGLLFSLLSCQLTGEQQKAVGDG